MVFSSHAPVAVSLSLFVALSSSGSAEPPEPQIIYVYWIKACALLLTPFQLFSSILQNICTFRYWKGTVSVTVKNWVGWSGSRGEDGPENRLRSFLMSIMVLMIRAMPPTISRASVHP